MGDTPARPLKRQRKATDNPPQDQQQHNHSQPPPQQPPQPVDHIFIADGLLNKKPGGKKAPLSCCECRRLKLKCDRNFPCASCKKRGCAEICPDGVLVSGKGTRFILANTEQLHAKIQEMSDRIRQLEDSVQRNEPASSLLSTDLMVIKSTMGLYSSNGATSAAQQKDDTRKLNGTAPEDDRTGMAADRTPIEDTMVLDPPARPKRSTTIDLSSLQLDIQSLDYSFPLPSSLTTTPDRSLAIREHIRSQLPSQEEALGLWNQVRQNALWQYNPDPSAMFFPNLLRHVYPAAMDHRPKPISAIDPRRLALLLMILAVACIVDTSPSIPPSASRTSPPHSPSSSSHSPCPTPTNPVHLAHLDSEARAMRYHALGRAALCESPYMEETNIDTVLALFYEVWYLAVWSDGKKAVGEAWAIMGLVARLAQSIGLHRKSSKSKIIPEDEEKRRALFWELLYLDARLSLSLGRPPSLSIQHVDCPRPSYIPDEECAPNESLHHFQEWKHSCYQQCLVPVLDAISRPGFEYKSILDLDRRIRDFSIPAPLRNKDKLTSRSLVMQRASLSSALEAVLLQLHRSYFMRAVSGPEEAFNRRHKYAPSVVAVFLSASRMIATVQELYQHEPELTSRILWYWSNAFSSAIALCLLVSRAPFTCLSPAALQELERARLLFRAAKDTCPRALQVVPILENMVDRANDIYNRWANGQELPTIVLRHITDDLFDEFDTRQSPAAPNEDPFLHTHQSLAQCIAEVHQIAKAMFPSRKPCSCSNNRLQQQAQQMQNPTSRGGRGQGKGVAVPDCPPSHEWSPPPVVNAAGPVLPDVPPVGYINNGSLMNVGYTVYANGRNGGRYSSLSGSGMSPSPSPGLYGTGSNSSPTLSNSTSGSNGGYGGYPNGGGGGGMYNGGGGYSKAGSPGFTNGSSSGGGTGLYSVGGSVAVLPASAPPVTLPQTSKLEVVDTINFELGALNSNSDQSFMWFY